MKLTAAVLTISDSCHRGEREDTSGPRLQQCLRDAGFEVLLSKIIPDEVEQIADALRQSASQARFVVTTGGTGISARDVTPEATRKVCERLLDGISELMRAEGLKQTPFAALSRGLCGTIESSLVLNVPGNPRGAEASLKAVLHLVPHTLDLLAGKTEHRDQSPESRG